MTFLSEASETMASHISTAEQEPVEKKCKFFCIYSRGILVYLKSSSSYLFINALTAGNHARDLQNFLQNSYVSFSKAKLGKILRLIKLFQVKRCVRIVRKVDVFRCIEVVQNNKFIIVDKAIVGINYTQISDVFESHTKST